MTKDEFRRSAVPSAAVPIWKSARAKKASLAHNATERGRDITEHCEEAKRGWKSICHKDKHACRALRFIQILRR
jgi:hypothetical protein